MKKAMKKIVLLVMMTGLPMISMLAQKMEPFSLEISKGEKIDEERIGVLVSKTWTPFRQYKVTNRQATLQGGQFFALKFFAEGELRATSGGRTLSGTWQREDKKSLRLEIADPTRSSVALRNFSGIYAIYAISDAQLVLVRDISETEKIVYYCKGNITRSIEEAESAASEDKAKKKAMQAKMEQEMLLEELQVEMLLRGERWKRKYEDFTTNQLKDMRQQLWKYGKYDKVRALRSELKMEASANDIALPADLEAMKYGELKKLQKQIQAQSAKKDKN